MILRYRANAVYRSESGDTPCIRLPVVLEGSSEAMHSWMLPYRTVPDSIHSGHPQPPPAQYPLPYQYARTEPTRRAGLSLFVLSLSLPPLAHLLLPVFPLFPFLFFFFFFFLFFFLSFLFFSPQGFLATLPRHRSPFPFLLAATAGFWCPVSRPAPNGA